MDNYTHHLKKGSLLNQRYRVDAAIGEGGFGITYAGWDTLLDMKVAVKEYYPHGYANRNNEQSSVVTMSLSSQKAYFEKGKEKFLQEARTLAKFAGMQGIVTVRDFFSENGTAYIVMEFLEGTTLSRYIKKHGLMRSEELIDLMLPLIGSLNAVHAAGLIHRDISPDNIMLMKDHTLKLMDFGAARDISITGQKSLSVMLKPGYAPEEQYRSRGKQGPWTDVYALCATMYKCLTGITPDDSTQRVYEDEVKTLSELGIAISDVHEKAIMKGMSVLQKDRYQNMQALSDALMGIETASEGAVVSHVSVENTFDETENTDGETEYYTEDYGMDDGESMTEDGTVSYMEDGAVDDGEEGTVDYSEDGTVDYSEDGSFDDGEDGIVRGSRIYSDEEKEETTEKTIGDSVRKKVESHAEDEKTLNKSEKTAERTRDKIAKPDSQTNKIDKKNEKKSDKKSQKAKPEKSERKQRKLAEKENKLKKEDKPKSEEKTSGKKRWLIAIPCILVVIILAVALSGKLGSINDSPYKSGSTASISNETVDEAMLEKIAEDEEISRLIFHRCEISDAMFEVIAGMPYIKTVEIYTCYGFTSLGTLADMASLEELCVAYEDYDDEGYMAFDGATVFSAEFAQVEELELSGWNLTSGNEFLVNFPSLVTLDMKNCTGFDDGEVFANCTQLEALYLSNTDVGVTGLAGLADCTQLEYIEASNCQISDLAWAGGMTSLTWLEIDNNEVVSLEALSNCPLRNLNAENNHLTNLTGLENNTELGHLYLNNNAISDLTGLENNTELKWLYLNSNAISDISVLGNCTALERLNLSDNDISSISSLAACTQINELYLSNNSLADLDAFEQMIYLTVLDASGNAITDISGLSNATLLEEVNLANNGISDISVLAKSVDALTMLQLGGNEIADISALSGAYNLYLLGVENNQLTDLDALSECASLYYLSAYGNQITDISGLAACTSLYFVDLGENDITDISALSAVLAEAAVLLLQNNSISDISTLKADCNYAGLSLYNNPISDFEVFGAMQSVSSKALLYVSYASDWDYSLIAASTFENNIKIVDAPLDQRTQLESVTKEVKGNYASLPEFIDTEEADAEIADYRRQIAEEMGISVEETTSETE